MDKINKPSNQLRWVILLLAVAVILPTVCLLWFMTQAVKNERLAVRQKLIDSYTIRAKEIFWKIPEDFINEPNNYCASVIYDPNYNMIYPVRSTLEMTYNSNNIPKVWQTEFSDANYDEAFKEYEKIAKISSIPDEVYQCQMGMIRCLIKQNKFDDAIIICRELAYPGKHVIAEFTPEQIARAKLMLINLYDKTKHNNLWQELQSQLSDLDANPQVSTETQVFILGKLIEAANEFGFKDKLKTEIVQAQKIIDSASLAITSADYADSNSIPQSKPEKIFFKLHTHESLYGIYFNTTERIELKILRKEKLTRLWQKNASDYTDELVFCRIYDNTGKQIAGEPKFYAGEEFVIGSVFMTLNLKDYFSGWKAELYLRAGVFGEVANRQRYIYIWVAAIVIVFMLASTIMAGKTVLTQAKLNRLKNNFIATVTHELKTPLASMRVLVDTLLEGNYNDQQAPSEYLQLISKENLRLSRLIDNFLTFSRMERNKQAFDFSRTDPAEIAKAAVEAVQTKFNHENCKFTVGVDEDLPSISADKDAMVTVLANLLDNAYKYSYDEKRIELSVSSQDSYICFSVKDNGIGMTRRDTKKIFNRFYQFDQSLARTSEGCGLGLSIVKFIVNAHKGQITVESKPDIGSEFKVIIPVCKG